MPDDKKKWVRKRLTIGVTYLLCGKGFYISYNPDPTLSLGGWALFAADYNSDETALCRGKKYYILNGDYRKQYEQLLDQGFNACKKFYDLQSNDDKSSWSSS